MPSTDRVRLRAARESRRLAMALGEELRDARVGSGLSQRDVGRAAGLSQSHVSRAELARRSSEWLQELWAHCAVLGLRPSIKLYPIGSPLRDAAQLRLIARFKARLHQSWRWTPEAPIGEYGDLRAWDVRLDGNGAIGVDAETRLHDIQALQRRFESKRRDSRVDRTVLLVGKTRHNLAVIREHREALASTFPAGTREVMAALRDGRLPAMNGMAVL